MSYNPIESYAMIGNLDTVALVGMDGSIDFMCFPDFDSPSLFAALLDAKKGGKFAITPQLEDPRHKQFYLPDTNILLTRFLSEVSVAEISDFMTIAGPDKPSLLVRRVKGIRGQVKCHVHFEPRFDYGRCEHKIEKKDGGYLFTPDHPKLKPVFLWTEVKLKISKGGLTGEFLLHAGESQSFALEECADELNKNDTSEAFKETMNYWRNWIERSTYRGRWREMVNRSALTLKMLTSRKHGSMVAAPTFGLPEAIGGERNWDYRYTWIRDGSFTLYALIRLGYTEEAGHFMRWIEHRCADRDPDSPLQIMYGLDGKKVLTEETLSHFEGYRGSKPVRVGNGAYNQLQLDIYGELMDSVYLYNKYGDPISIDLWLNLKSLIDWVCLHWKSADEGIWEIRGGQQEFLYSRLMCWVAIDRAIRLARVRSFPAPFGEWLKMRDLIYHDILEHFWNKEEQSFVQTKGGTFLDASSLMLPLMKFIGPKDPRFLSTLHRIKQRLVDDSLVHRYRVCDAASDGLSGGEGTFNMCSFWYVECLSRAGDLQQSRFIFEKMHGYANHVGLYAEELGASGHHLGNFPQAFTHLGLISAAYDLDRRLDGYVRHF